MRVIVRLYAVARQRAGRSEVEVDLDEPATVGDLRRALAETVPALAPMSAHVMIAVDREYAADEATIPTNAEVAVIPPVSGGSREPGDEGKR